MLQHRAQVPSLGPDTILLSLALLLLSAIAAMQLSSRCRPFTSVGARHAKHQPTRAVATRAVQMEQQAMTIVGGGRVGLALADMGPGNDVVIRRNEPVTGPAGPIVVCTRNDDLQSIVEATAADRREDLVFIQNGMLQPWLDAQGLGENTQVLVYFAVAKKGEAPIDGKTDVNPEGLTAAYGKHAQAVASRLQSGGLSCKVLDKAAFTKAMLEKLVWISGVMLVGQKHKAIVGQVEKEHSEEVSKLFAELAAAGSKELGVQLDAGVVERLNAYSRSVAHFPTAVKEFQWRNGWFYAISQKAAAAGLPDPMPMHTALLKEVGAI